MGHAGLYFARRQASSLIPRAIPLQFCSSKRISSGNAVRQARQMAHRGHYAESIDNKQNLYACPSANQNTKARRNPPGMSGYKILCRLKSDPRQRPPCRLDRAVHAPQPVRASGDAARLRARLHALAVGAGQRSLAAGAPSIAAPHGEVLGLAQLYTQHACRAGATGHASDSADRRRRARSAWLKGLLMIGNSSSAR
jgi:hypothetical protein